MSARTLPAFWRLVLVQLMREAHELATSGTDEHRVWLAFTGGCAGILAGVEGAPRALSCTLDALLEYGIAVVNELGLQRVSELGDQVLTDLGPTRATEVEEVRGNSAPGSA